MNIVAELSGKPESLRAHAMRRVTMLVDKILKSLGLCRLKSVQVPAKSDTEKKFIKNIMDFGVRTRKVSMNQLIHGDVLAQPVVPFVMADGTLNPDRLHKPQDGEKIQVRVLKNRTGSVNFKIDWAELVKNLDSASKADVVLGVFDNKPSHKAENDEPQNDLAQVLEDSTPLNIEPAMLDPTRHVVGGSSRRVS
jgi:hypothetical protein